MLNAAPTAESYVLLAADAAYEGGDSTSVLDARFKGLNSPRALIMDAWTQQVYLAVFRSGIHDSWAVGNPPNPQPLFRPQGWIRGP